MLRETIDTWVIYHDHCNDGFGAAWAAYRRLGNSPGNSPTYLPALYGSDPPHLRPDDQVYILDFSYPFAITSRIAEACHLVLIDHHATAAADLGGLAGCRFDLSRSAAIPAWEYFCPQEPVPEILLYVEDRDLWKWQLPHSREINAALGELPREFAAWDRAAADGTSVLIKTGTKLLARQEATALRQAHAAHPAVIAGYTVLAAECDELRSETANTMLLLNPPIPFAAVYHRTQQNDQPAVQVSLRSRPDFDVSTLARRFGGGGHPQAAGFTITDGLPTDGPVTELWPEPDASAE